MFVIIICNIFILKNYRNLFPASCISTPEITDDNTMIYTIQSQFLSNSHALSKYNFVRGEDKVMENIVVKSVAPNKRMEIKFNYTPLSCGIFNRIENGNHQLIRQFDMKSNNEAYLITPAEKGKYTYSLSVEYKEGLAIYYFSIDVI